MKLLFVCSANALRSPTAEAVFSHYEGIEAASAGTNADAETPVSADLIEWADVVIVMEQHHAQFLQVRFGYLLRRRRVSVLGIPDRYDFMEPDLVQLLKDKVDLQLPRWRNEIADEGRA
ncbi:low molecular weight protein tyrosine phosphatase family protein [Terracidiphilus gabretensis]|uniref:low molecular weight protein tyrosine phosphatase family protein n=1 Tax=Terracidiphilus gabretensis TaxID=1577687 RepID=UPI00071C172D|nr:phosphotyrosine protein phosphatase [Terracidiphilus gabretensis]